MRAERKEENARQRIFISSTFDSLSNYRARVLEALDAISAFEIAIRSAGAHYLPAVEYCKSEIAHSDAVVLVVGKNPGSIPAEEVRAGGSRSFTWVETEHAFNLQKRIFAFVDKDLLNLPDYSDCSSFVSWLKTVCTPLPFYNADDLALKVVSCLARHFLVPVRKFDEPQFLKKSIYSHEVRINDFFEKSDEVSLIDAWHSKFDQNENFLFVSGIGGSGKSTLVCEWINARKTSLEECFRFIYYWNFSDRSDPVAMIRSLYNGLGGQNLGETRQQLRWVIQNFSGSDAGVLLIFDGLDRIAGRMTDAGTAAGEAVEIVSDLLISIENLGNRCRAIGCSRFPIGILKRPVAIKIRPLINEEALRLLRHRIHDIEDGAADICVKKANGHPLSLLALGHLARNGHHVDLIPAELRKAKNSNRIAMTLVEMLADYARILTEQERIVLAAISTFPRGVPFERCEDVIGVEPEISTDVDLGESATEINDIFRSLFDIGILSKYKILDTIFVQPHSFVGNWFSSMAGMSQDEVGRELESFSSPYLSSQTCTPNRHGMGFLLRQLSAPDVKWLAPWTAWWFNVINYHANIYAANSFGDLDGKRILEVGIGGGMGVRTLLRRSSTVVVDGIDASRLMIETAVRTFSNEIRAKRLNLHVCEIGEEQVAYPDCTFDGVLSVCTFPFWKDAAMVLDEILRVLNPGGVLRLVVESFRLEYLDSFPRRNFSIVDEGVVVSYLTHCGFEKVSWCCMADGAVNFTLISAEKPKSRGNMADRCIVPGVQVG